MLGPYKEETARVEVEVLEPEMNEIRRAIDVLRARGVKVSSKAYMH